MITPEQVWLAVEPVDMRMGIDGLSLRVLQLLGCSSPQQKKFAQCKKPLTAWSGEVGDRLSSLAPKRENRNGYVFEFSMNRRIVRDSGLSLAISRARVWPSI